MSEYRKRSKNAFESKRRARSATTRIKWRYALELYDITLKRTISFESALSHLSSPRSSNCTFVSMFPRVVREKWHYTEICEIMSSNSEFSTMSSEEMPSLPKSLPSSREATAEGSSGSGGGYMPLREFLDRFSLPRVVRLEGTSGRPVLLYKQQQRSLRVTASLLMHRYRHDVKVGPEIVIPEGYPGEFFSIGIWIGTIIARSTTLQSVRPFTLLFFAEDYSGKRIDLRF